MQRHSHRACTAQTSEAFTALRIRHIRQLAKPFSVHSRGSPGRDAHRGSIGLIPDFCRGICDCQSGSWRIAQGSGVVTGNQLATILAGRVATHVTPEPCGVISITDRIEISASGQLTHRQSAPRGISGPICVTNPGYNVVRGTCPSIAGGPCPYFVTLEGVLRDGMFFRWAP